MNITPEKLLRVLGTPDKVRECMGLFLLMAGEVAVIPQTVNRESCGFKTDPVTVYKTFLIIEASVNLPGCFTALPVPEDFTVENMAEPLVGTPVTIYDHRTAQSAIQMLKDHSKDPEGYLMAMQERMVAMFEAMNLDPDTVNNLLAL